MASSESDVQPSSAPSAAAASSTVSLHQVPASSASPSQLASSVTASPPQSTSGAQPHPTSQQPVPGTAAPPSAPTSPTALVGGQVDSLTQLLGTTHSASNMLVNSNSSNSSFLPRANVSSTGAVAPPPSSLFLSSIPFGASTSSSHDDISFCFEPHCVEPFVCHRRHVHLTLTEAGASRLTLCEVPATLLRLTVGKSRLLETIRHSPTGSVVSNGRFPGASATLDAGGATLRLCRHPDFASCPLQHDCADAHVVDDPILQRQPSTVWACIQRIRGLSPLPQFSLRVVHKTSEMLSFPAQVTGVLAHGAGAIHGVNESGGVMIMAAGAGGNPTDVSIMTDNASSVTFGDHMPVVVAKEKMLLETTAVVTQSDDESDK